MLLCTLNKESDSSVIHWRDDSKYLVANRFENKRMFVKLLKYSTAKLCYRRYTCPDVYEMHDVRTITKKLILMRIRYLRNTSWVVSAFICYIVVTETAYGVFFVLYYSDVDLTHIRPGQFCKDQILYFMTEVISQIQIKFSTCIYIELKVSLWRVNKVDIYKT